MEINTNNDSNINVNLITPQEDGEEIVISLSEIVNNLKKYLAVWLVLAIIVGCVVTAFGIFSRKSSYVGDVSALIAFSYDGAELGLDPKGNELDVTKVKSPNIINDALISLDMDTDMTDKVRNAVGIKEIVPQDTMSRLSVYMEAFSNSPGMDGAMEIANTEYNATEFVISFDYFAAGCDIHEGEEVLNEILEQYKEYFLEQYSSNESLGSTVTVIDYKDYDYAEAVNIFDSTMRSINDYVTTLESEDVTSFRSTKTGYTFGDLRRKAEIIKDIDLDVSTSYIIGNNVTKNKSEDMKTYYTYAIEQLERKNQALEKTLKSVNESILNYEKDPLVLVVGSSTDTSDQDLTKNMNVEYDNLVGQKVEIQKSIARNNQDIEKFKANLEIVKTTGTTSEATEKADTYLEDLNTKINQLIKDTKDTADEYYTKVAFANSFRVLVPASGIESNLVSDVTVKFALIAEGVLLVLYLVVSFVMAIVVSTARKKKEKKASAE